MSLFDLRVIWISTNLKPASRRLCDMRICERYKPPFQKTYLLLSAWECKEHIVLNHFPTAMKPTESFPGPRVVLINGSDGKDEGTFSRGFAANMIRLWNANPRISQDSKNESVQFPSPSMIPSAPFQLEAVRPVKWWPFTPSSLQSFNHFRVMCLCNRVDTWSRHQSRYNCIPLDMDQTLGIYTSGR